VGGMETGVNEYPMMAGLVDSLQVEVFCGATIISERHVLTAAHCLENVDPSTVGVLVGDHDLTTGKHFFQKQMFLKYYICITFLLIYVGIFFFLLLFSFYCFSINLVSLCQC